MSAKRFAKLWKKWVRPRRNELGLGRARDCVPLVPEAAREAELDWGSAWIQMEGTARRMQLLCKRSRNTGKSFGRAYRRQGQEMLLDGQIRASSWFGSVFPVLVGDNPKMTVKRTRGCKARIEQERCVSFRSYYTFQTRNCSPARKEEEGEVEGSIGFLRQNFLPPIPHFKDFQELYALPERRCWQYGSGRIGGREDRPTVEQRLREESIRLLKHPDRPSEIRKVFAVPIDHDQTTNIGRNRFVVPRAYWGSRLWALLRCDKVKIRSGGRHTRSSAFADVTITAALQDRRGLRWFMHDFNWKSQRLPETLKRRKHSKSKNANRSAAATDSALRLNKDEVPEVTPCRSPNVFGINSFFDISPCCCSAVEQRFKRLVS